MGLSRLPQRYLNPYETGYGAPWRAFRRSSIQFEDLIQLDYAHVASWSISPGMLLLPTIGAAIKREGAL